MTDVVLRRNRADTISDSFVLIAGSVLLQFTKIVIGLSKIVMRAAIKMVIIKAGGSSRLCRSFSRRRRFTRTQQIA